MKNKWVMFLLGIALPGLVNAHGRWIVPSHTVVSGKEPTSISVDMSISNDVFHADNAYGGVPLAAIGDGEAKTGEAKIGETATRRKEQVPEHPLAKVARSTRLFVSKPDGSQSSEYKIINLGRKSVSSVPLNQNGTYRLEVVQDPVFFTAFKTGDHNHGRVFGIGKQAQSQLPRDAQKVQGVKLINRVQTFVTRNQSSKETIEPALQGLSLRFHHHPNDLFANESLTVTVLLNRVPQTGAHIKVTKGGTRYRNDRKSLSLVTDEKGMAKITWDGAGLYVLESEVELAAEEKAYDRQIAALYVTLEVFPE